MRENIPPEEKLLRLIRNPKKHGEIPAAKPSQALPQELKPKIQNYFSNLFSLITIPKIISAVFIASCLYFAISFSYPFFGLRKINLPKLDEEQKKEAKAEVTEGKSLEFYEQGIGNREIFGSVSALDGGKPASAANIDVIKEINLVGIIAGNNPQAVIEDKKSLKTFYVTKGQLVGEVQIEDIQEGKIILNYRGQKYELYL